MKNYDICPICGTIGRKSFHWTYSNNKKYEYIVFRHENGIIHRLNSRNKTSTQSKSSLVRDFLMLKLQKPMRFSEIIDTINKSLPFDIDNKVLSRSLKSLIKRGEIQKVYKDGTYYYSKGDRKEEAEIKIEKLSISILNRSFQLFESFHSESKYLIQEIPIYFPFEINSDPEIEIYDKFGPISTKNLQFIYALKDKTLAKIKLNRELKEGDWSFIFISLDKKKTGNPIMIFISFDTMEVEINTSQNMEKVELIDKDLFISRSPDLINNMTALDGTKVHTAKLFKVKKNQTVKILF